MEPIHFTLSNSGKELNNDVVFNDTLFKIQENAYLFKLFPKSPYWRFGIRLSESEEILFYHPRDRYPDSEHIQYIDLHLGTGQWENSRWTVPESLALAQYNLAGQNPILQKTDKYHPNEEISWLIQYIPGKQGLFITYEFGGRERFGKFYLLPNKFRFFQIFAWADATDFEIEAVVEITPLYELSNDTRPFRLENITFRLGDMFDNWAIDKANLVILPASSTGTASTTILNRAAELGIPSPTRNGPGTISLYHVPLKSRNLTAGYAYSVDDNLSTIEMIRDICGAISDYAENDKETKIINLPLLGTGAGRLNAIAVADVFDKYFNLPSENKKYIVSIRNPDDFYEVKQIFKAHYYPVLDDFPIEKPKAIMELERALRININGADFRLGLKKEILALNLSQFNLSGGELLTNFKSLRELNISNSKFNDYQFLLELKELTILYMANSHFIGSFGMIGELSQLEVLDLSNNNVGNVKFLENNTKLKSLQLRNNHISDISSLKALTNLEYLDLCNNQIRDISVLKHYVNLRNLNISKNDIFSIPVLKSAKKLSILDISSNSISDGTVLLELKQLTYLKADKNDFVFGIDLRLDERENHLPAVRNILLRQEEQNKISVTLPAKILLLGNHASGKSSLLNYIQNDDLPASMSSTHIINIEKYPKNNVGLPLAIFYDFGGQDYYHGIYRAFLSRGSVYLILWDRSSNHNRQRIDSNNVPTQDFTLNYWLWQKKYLEQEKFENIKDPILLIQSHADQDPKYTPNLSNDHEIANEFYVSFKKISDSASISKVNGFALQYLKASVIDLIERKRITRKEPQWYVDFIQYILLANESSNYLGTHLSPDILNHYHRDDQDIELLKDDLDQLHKQGLILYYKNEIPDKAWLNPVKLVKHIHDEILNRNFFDKENPGVVRSSLLESFETDIIELLVKQKVLFKHEQDNTYIIPNFLPLAEENKNEYSLLTFGLDNPLFTLKFQHFLPFGLINQVICFFGQLPDIKKFWRDQLLFTIDGHAKILININFQKLEIKVFASFMPGYDKTEKADVTRYLFYGLLGLYWDLDLLSYANFKEYKKGNLKLDTFDPFHPLYSQIYMANDLYQKDECRPVDLYLSVDNESFIQYNLLCGIKDEVMIQSFQLDDAGNFIEKNIIPIYPFQPFTSHLLKRPRKAVISYSKKDIDYVLRFKQYLIPLSDEGLLEKPWYCTELVAGTEWDDIIQQKFNDADIIFFMISDNLMATQYVKDHEIKNAIDRWDGDQSIKIVPILLVPYPWVREGTYNLGRFTALPYTAMPVSSFPDQHLAWDYISQAIRLMIVHDLYPGSEPYEQSNDMKEFFKRVMKLRQYIE